MTLKGIYCSEIDDMDNQEKKKMKHMKKMLERALRKAVAEDRVTIGTYQCARQVQGRPDRVLYCVLPENQEEDDYLKKIERIFLEAYCRENRIFVIRIQDCVHLQSIFRKHNKSKCDEQDFHCAMVHAGRSDVPCQEELMFMDHCRDVTSGDPWLMVHVAS